jgi:hypothetical protein
MVELMHQYNDPSRGSGDTLIGGPVSLIRFGGMSDGK